MAGLTACGEITRANDPDRYLCSLFAPLREREALFAILAFNHEVAKTREVVSETMLGQVRLQWWREAIDGILAGTPRQHEVVLPLAKAFEAFSLERDAFDAILDAREADLEDAPFQTNDDLMAYARATAGALSRITLRILGVSDDATMMAGEAVAIAWALTGLLRSTPFLARYKRLMLPRDLLDAHRARIGDYHELRDHTELRAVVEVMVGIARNYLARGNSHTNTGFKKAAPVFLQARLAQLYLDRLERASFNLFDPGVNAEMPLKSWAVWWASVRQRV